MKSDKSGKETFHDLTDVPQQPDQPPVAPARVAAMKARYRQAWMYFLLIVSLAVAWGMPIRYLVMRYLLFRHVNTGPRVADSFVAIAYEGISENPREVSPQRFREHFNTLKAAGYNPITLKEIHEFFSEGRLLPQKAILLTFDHSRKSSYYIVRSLLSRAGWPAVMFLWTHAIESEDPASLRWPYVRTMVRSGAWEVGAQSHRGFERIVADSDGTLRNFFTAPRWLAEEQRYETPEAFRRRLEEDHEYTINLIRRETGVRPRAFAFPYGDFGQYDERAMLSRRFNMDLVAKYYDLGFVHGDFALNTRFSDPRRLNRLLVKPEWTGEELVRRLESAWPREQGITSAEAATNQLAWICEWGGFEFTNGALRLFAPPSITGAKVWLNGSSLFGDLTAKIRLAPGRRGQFGVYLRASPDGERHLYLGIGEGGDIWLRQKHPGLQPFTLASGRCPPSPDGSLELEIQLRGRHFYAAIGGKPVFPEIVTTRGEPIPGMLGLSVWDPHPARADVSVALFEAKPMPPTLLTWTPLPARDPTLAAWLRTHAIRYSHLASPWIRVAARAQAEQLGWEPELYRRLSRLYNMKWTPEVALDYLEQLDPALPEQLAALAQQHKVDGLFVDLFEVRGAPALSRITAFVQSLSQALEKRGLQLIIRMPAAFEQESSYLPLLQGITNIFIAAARNAPTPASLGREGGNRIVRIERVTIDRIETPFFHLLTGLDATNRMIDTEMRGKLLRQDGFDAFHAGRFDEALEIWRRWSELEPHSEEPWRLIGDVHLRKNEFPQAIEAYRASLERNPGQIDLVVQAARLLDQRINNRIAAGELLDLYARLFPGNASLLLAQAEVLVRQGIHEPAVSLIRRVIDENPDDIEAFCMLHGLLQSSADRIANLQKILEIGSRPGLEPHFANLIRHYDLLSWPESWILLDFIERMAEQERQSGRPGPYSQLVPRKTVVRESFQLNRISANWQSDSDTSEAEGGLYLLAASPAAAEAVLRLRNSECLQSGFIEAAFDEARGFFWLYARRGADSMARFGFEQSGRMYLQIWDKGRLLVNQMRPWTKPDGTVRLRLTIRGDGLFGFVNDVPAFGAPVRLPPDLGLGWWGISPWAPTFGEAQVALREIAGGPVPVTIGLLWPRVNGWDDDEAVALLKPHALELHAIAPPWFVQDAAGRIRAEGGREYTNLRMLCRYYQIRLMPSVQSASPRTLNLDELIQLAKEAQVDGFTLVFVRLPDEEWFRNADAKMADSGVGLLCVRPNRLDNSIEVREVHPRISLLPGRRIARTIPLIDMSKPMPELQGPPSPPPGADPAIESLPPPDRVLLFP